MVWNQSFPVIGSQSSPRASELNGDGVLDIVMGAGKNEYQHSEQGIIALNGKTGELLWQQEAPDQVYGSATFVDINNDNIKDVFIGGRSPHFKALNGKNGDVIWQFNYEQYKEHPVIKYARYNFNNSVLIPDQNNDGIGDLLTVNGGNSKAEPYSEANRYPAVLMIFDSKTGGVIAADTMPDGKESYMTPICFSQPDGAPTVVFGTGGETIDGNLFIVSLSDLKNRNLSKARSIASEKGHGFIAPPLAADINHDGFYEIVAISHASTTFAINGKDLNLLWKQHVPNTESSNSLAVGYFTKDDVPDFFTFISKGVWPNNTRTMQILLDGKDGRIAFVDSLGCTGYSSPVVYDVNNDGYDEAIISINDFDCSLGFAGKSPSTIENRLVAFDFMSNRIIPIDQQKGFKNIFSTPWIGDLDDDGYLDIVHCQYYHRGDLLSFLGMNVKRIDTPIKLRSDLKWSAYMGSKMNGVFK